MISTASTTVFDSETVLGKRKSPTSFVLHLFNDSTSQLPSKKPPPIIVNGSLVPHTNKRYKCTYSNCEKSYSKPSRLSEHERSHTGQRPFVCNICNKSYLRETHLQAHARSHLPESSRPLACTEANCGKRFWTSQHLRVHENWHKGLNSLQCPELGCDAKFTKNHQLRAHICSVHSAPGTRPYRCEHEGCAKSFATNQHLRSHSKLHDEKRYICVHVTCLAGPENIPSYFPTWSVLQHHIRTVHPPTCAHPSCQGRTFTSQKGLRAHQKLHEERELEKNMANGIAAEDEDVGGMTPPWKRRRGGEIGRDWKCDVDDCDKDFKSRTARATHINVSHLGRRDHTCPHENCKQSYGYKHLLQRHLAKVHVSVASDSGISSSEDDGAIDLVDANPSGRSKPSGSLDIDTLTGQSYAKRAHANIADSKALHCPYPDVDMLMDTSANEQEIPVGLHCQYAFSRAYDLRRHLRAAHKFDCAKEKLEEWVKDRKRVAHA